MRKNNLSRDLQID